MYQPDPRILQLDDGFYDKVEAADFPKLQLRYRNQRAAAEVGLDSLDSTQWEQAFARFQPLPGNLPNPLALRYHGHQFTHYNPQLGDGRGFLHAQLRDGSGRLLDLGTKGSGTTPWSRGGDGRLTLKGGFREVLAAELLEAFGVPTCRIFSLYETGEELDRHDEPSPTRASVMVRLSHSHIRFGTFQRLAYLRDKTRLEKLLEYSVAHYYPGLPLHPATFLRAVAEKKAETVAGWMVAGFVHGVLNTDNMNITGESFDYGPWRWIPNYDPDFTAAYFDGNGLYAYGRQATMVGWNLQQLARALEPLAPMTELKPAIDAYETALQGAYRRRLLQRLGLVSRPELDDALVVATVRLLERSRVGYDQFFYDWYGGVASEARAAVSPSAGYYKGEAYNSWRKLLESYAPAFPERLRDPYFGGETPCSMLIGELEALWDQVAMADRWEPFYQKVAEIRAMGALFQFGEGDKPATEVQDADAAVDARM